MRAEPCQPLSLQAPQSSKRQQLQPSLRTHTDCAGFQAVQPWPEMPGVGEVGGFSNNLVEESAVATEQVFLLMPGYHRKFGSLDS